MKFPQKFNGLQNGEHLHPCHEQMAVTKSKIYRFPTSDAHNFEKCLSTRAIPE
jgi:hypothetical protein